MNNLFIHLTNSSIQKRNAEGPTQDNPLMKNGEESNGSKISLSGDNGLWNRFKRTGIDVDIVWKNITNLIIKSLVPGHSIS